MVFTDAVYTKKINKKKKMFKPRKLAQPLSLAHNLSISTVLPFVIFCCHGFSERQSSMNIGNGGVAAHGT